MHDCNAIVEEKSIKYKYTIKSRRSRIRIKNEDIKQCYIQMFGGQMLIEGLLK